MLHTFLTPGPVSFTVLRGGFYRVIAYGGGGHGGNSAGTEASEGGGGGAAKKRVYLRKGQLVTMTIGGPGANTTITLPDGMVFGATKGDGGSAGYSPGGLGGVGSGGDENRTGGTGRGEIDVDGDPDTGGGPTTGTTGEGNPGGGGGSGAAFLEDAPGVTGGRGGTVGFGVGSPGLPGAAAIVGPEN